MILNFKINNNIEIYYFQEIIPKLFIVNDIKYSLKYN